MLIISLLLCNCCFQLIVTFPFVIQLSVTSSSRHPAAFHSSVVHMFVTSSFCHSAVYHLFLLSFSCLSPLPPAIKLFFTYSSFYSAAFYSSVIHMFVTSSFCIPLPSVHETLFVISRFIPSSSSSSTYPSCHTMCPLLFLSPSRTLLLLYLSPFCLSARFLISWPFVSFMESNYIIEI